MGLDDLRALLEQVEPELAAAPFVVVQTFERDGRRLHVGVTERLRRAARRGRVWKSAAFLTALKNAAYGFDEAKARSLGGADGIFLLDRSFSPRNEMMRRLFDRFLDRSGGDAEALARALGADVAQLLPVRLVSHHMRLLGVLHRRADSDTLVLVDYDDG